ncbi:MAG: anthranilate synthase component I [Proteobacteria bacterium]|nr:anthranilate synthase component I [Pseudomonadota bacterium]
MSYNLSEAEFDSALEKSGRTVLFKKIPADVITPVLASLKIFQHFPEHHFLFESVEKGSHKGRFSVLGCMPDLIWRCVGEKSFRDDREENGQALDNFRNLVKESQINWDDLTHGLSALPAMASGIFGYMSYDMIRLMEKISNHNLPDEIKIPDSIFIRPQIIVVFDSLFDCALICAPVFSKQNYSSVLARIETIEEILTKTHETSPIVAKHNLQFSSNCSKEEYCGMVRQAKKYITDGDIFQVLPSQRFTAKCDENFDEFSFYRSLRLVNPSPFLFYLKFDDFVLTGSSPEIMVSLKNKKVTIRPLAGTRKRGKNEVEDKKIAAELLNDEKEVAEHLMLIDLGRHDVGSVAVSGSVVVTEKMTVENYSHVMHISSNVEGILREEFDALDALVAGFPAGTVSGAPKIRAMGIIEEIEKVRRSFYAGCVGYFASNGDMETCITLRSALIREGKIHLQTGAGVVFDSDPESEYQECLNKARVLMSV